MPRDWLPSKAQVDALQRLRKGSIVSTSKTTGVSWASVDILVRRGLACDVREAFAPRTITITAAGDRVLDRYLALNPTERDES